MPRIRPSGAAPPHATRPGTVSYLRQNAPAAAHALQLLKLLARHAAPLPASAIARDLGLPRSTTYHLLNVLQDEGFVVHLPEERRYGLGVGAYELGSAYLRQDPLRWIAQTGAHPAGRRHHPQRPPRGAAGPRGAVRDRGARARTARPGHRRRRPPARPPDRERPGDARRAPAAAGRRALPQPPRADPPPRRRPRLAHPAARAPARARAAPATPRRTGSSRPASPRSPAPVLDHTGHPIAAVAVTYPAAEGEPGGAGRPRRPRRRTGHARIRGSRT